MICGISWNAKRDGRRICLIRKLSRQLNAMQRLARLLGQLWELEPHLFLGSAQSLAPPLSEPVKGEERQDSWPLSKLLLLLEVPDNSVVPSAGVLNRLGNSPPMNWLHS